MAYKFQLGNAILSGSLTQKEGLNAGDDGLANAGAIGGVTTISGSGKIQMGSLALGGTDVSSTATELNFVDGSGAGTVVNSKAVIYGAAGQVNGTQLSASLGLSGSTLTLGGTAVTATAAELNVLDGLAQGRILVGDGSDAASILDASGDTKMLIGNGTTLTSVALSGDINVANDGTATIQANAVEGSMLNNNTISGQTEMTGDLADTDELLVSDAGTLKRADFSVVRDAVFNDVSGDATIAAGGALTIAANAVEGSMLNSNVAGTGLSLDGGNLDVAAAQTSITSIINSGLGAIGTAADQEYIDFGTANQIHFVVNDTPVARATAGTFIVDGNLHVSGTTTSVDSTTINISSSFTFEGPVDAHETILTCGTPSQDNTVTLPQFSASAGAGTYHIPVLTGATTAASALVTPAEFALLDGGSTVGDSTTITTGDGFLHNDGGTMKQTEIDAIATAFAGNGLQAAGVGMSIKLDTGAGGGNSFAVAGDGLSLKSNVAGAGLALASGVLSVDIDELTELAEAPHATQDEFMVSDNGTEKRVSMTNVANGAFALVSGDATIAAGGALTIAAGAVEHGMLNDNIISGQTELTAAELANADDLLIHDATDNVVKKVGVDTLKTFINIGATPATVAAGDSLTEPGVYYMADMGSDGEDTITIGAADNWVHGMSIKLKLPSDASSARYVTVNTSGAQFIDGAASIRLESPFAAVELIYVADNTWRVF